MKKTTSNFGEALRSLRQARRLSVSVFANRLGVDKSYISRLENGKAKPSDRFVQELAKKFRANLEELRLSAGKLPQDVVKAFYDHPQETISLFREALGAYSGKNGNGESNAAASSTLQFAGKIDGRPRFRLYRADCLKWLDTCPSDSMHAVVTDPPFGLREYTNVEIQKLRNGQGGVWRIPPSFGGSKRAPVPRFTILTKVDLERMYEFFLSWSEKICRVLVPGGHVLIASTQLHSQLVYRALIDGGLEKRAEIVRLVRTLRGGDRPKNAEREFSDVCAMPRSCWEPWGVFRKPFQGTLAENLRRWGAGGLRRLSGDSPFPDVIDSSRTPRRERMIAPHPTLKPQHFLRQLVLAALPLGKGTILDPFAGAGSTLAAAEALGYESIGIEIDEEYVNIARAAIPKLARLSVTDKSENSTLLLAQKGRATQPTLFPELV